MRDGVNKSVHYYDDEGRHHLSKTAQLAVKRGTELEIAKYVVFTSDGDGALALTKHLKETPAKVVAVSFPYKQPFKIADDGGTTHEVFPGTSSPEVAKALADAGISLVRGPAPFAESFFIPGVKDPKLEGIRYALQLISGGLHLCIQAITMATDAGYLEPGEDVVSMAADTAIVASASSTRLLFHPQVGMEIREIICKPRKLTLTRDRGNRPH
mgnify:CR=1 FL=1